TLPYLFDTPVTFASSHIYVYQLTTGDFNGDGRPDVAATWEDGSPTGPTTGLGIYRGTASGFAHVQDYSFVDYSGTDQVEAADLNQDGRADLVKEHRRYPNFDFAIFLAAPDSLQPPTHETINPYGLSPFTLADATGDGIVDIVTVAGTSSSGAEMWILKGT